MKELQIFCQLFRKFGYYLCIQMLTMFKNNTVKASTTPLQSILASFDTAGCQFVAQKCTSVLGTC